jgi:hypothetical protein
VVDVESLVDMVVLEEVVSDAVVVDSVVVVVDSVDVVVSDVVVVESVVVVVDSVDVVVSDVVVVDSVVVVVVSDVVVSAVVVDSVDVVVSTVVSSKTGRLKDLVVLGRHSFGQMAQRIGNDGFIQPVCLMSSQPKEPRLRMTSLELSGTAGHMVLSPARTADGPDEMPARSRQTARQQIWLYCECSISN